MKIGYLSDLHLNWYCSKKYSFHTNPILDNVLNFEEADALIIAGDIGYGFSNPNINENDRDNFLYNLKKYFKNIIYVPGNHDYYLNNIDYHNNLSSSDLLKRDKDVLTNKFDFIYLGIDKLSVNINNIKIAGACGWYDGSYNPEEIKDMRILWNNFMSDSRCIYEHHDISNGKKVLTKIYDFDNYLKEELDKLKSIGQTDIMVTHIPPIIFSNMRPEYKASSTTGFFAFNGKEFLDNTKYWLCGHTHDVLEEDITNDNGTITKVLCNPLGYPHESVNKQIKYFEIKE